MAKTTADKPGDRVKCPTCGGTGTDPARSYTEHPPCPTCKGEGTITRAKLAGIEEAQNSAAEPEPPESEPEPEVGVGERPV